MASLCLLIISKMPNCRRQKLQYEHSISAQQRVCQYRFKHLCDWAELTTCKEPTIKDTTLWRAYYVIYSSKIYKEFSIMLTFVVKLSFRPVNLCSLGLRPFWSPLRHHLILVGTVHTHTHMHTRRKARARFFHFAVKVVGGWCCSASLWLNELINVVFADSKYRYCCWIFLLTLLLSHSRASSSSTIYSRLEVIVCGTSGIWTILSSSSIYSFNFLRTKKK